MLGRQEQEAANESKDAFGTGTEIKYLNLFHLRGQTYNFIRFGRNQTEKGNGEELEGWFVWEGELH